MNFELKNLNWIDDLVPGLIIQGKQNLIGEKIALKIYQTQNMTVKEVMLSLMPAFIKITKL